MKLHEYQSKLIFSKYGIPIPKGRVAANASEARQIAEELGGRVPDSLADAYTLISNAGQAVMAPPRVPSDRITFLRNAFKDLSNNTDLIKGIEKLVGYAAPFESGEKMQADVEKIMSNKALGSQLKSLVDKFTAAR